MAEIIEEINPNPEIKTYKKLEGILIIESTHENPVVHSESHSIEQIQTKINKINGVISLWQEKKLPLQIIIDKYNSLEVV